MKSANVGTGLSVAVALMIGVGVAGSGSRGTAAGRPAPSAEARGEVRESQSEKGTAVMQKIVKTDEEWKRLLTPEQYVVARGKGTEPPFCGAFYDHKQPGTYACVCCGLPLFSSDAKFDSGTGWPSFFQPVAPENVVTRDDLSHGMRRSEILCARCDAHLGHVFEDGQKPSGLRYCLNSVSLAFTPTAAKAAQPVAAGPQKATFAAGCFWGVEALFSQVKGVVSTQVGYTGGHTKDPTYEQVCTDKTGHAEAVEVVFDPAQVSYEELLKVFWENHNPTTRNRQGPDTGSQYRSMVFYHTPEQKAAAEALKAKLTASGAYPKPVVTEVVPAGPFYRAEEYHQQYFKKHGGPSCHIKQ